MSDDFLSGAALFRDLDIYAGMGDHRTAGQGEERTTQWIAGELEKAGLRVAYQDITLRQYFVKNCSLALGDRTIDCFPWWYPCGTGQLLQTLIAPPGTDAAGVAGKMALVKQRGSWMSRRSRPEVDKVVADLVSAGAQAVVFISESPSGELVAVNTACGTPPWPIPAVLVGPKDDPALVRAAESGTPASLLVSGEDNPNALARNLFGRWNGTGQDFIVVSTPKSGWFSCGGERGPGIALTLAIARWIGKRRPGVSYWLDFNTGHELGNLGARRFLAEVAPPPARVRLWVHLGANIATYRFEAAPSGLLKHADTSGYPLVASHSEVLPLLQEAFSHLPGITPEVKPGIGEFRPVVRAGYRGFGLNGGPYHYFHTPIDGVQGTAPEMLEPVLRAVLNALEAAERPPPK